MSIAKYYPRNSGQTRQQSMDVQQSMVRCKELCADLTFMTVWPSGLRRWLKAPKGRGFGPHSCQIVEHDMTTTDGRFNITTIRMQLRHNPRSLAHKQNANFTWITLSKQRILHAFWNPCANYTQKIKKPPQNWLRPGSPHSPQ